MFKWNIYNLYILHYQKKKIKFTSTFILKCKTVNINKILSNIILVLYSRYYYIIIFVMIFILYNNNIYNLLYYYLIDFNKVIFCLLEWNIRVPKILKNAKISFVYILVLTFFCCCINGYSSCVYTYFIR